MLCDGCNVRVPWEHRCHGAAVCDCPECRELEAMTPEEIEAALAAMEITDPSTTRFYQDRQITQEKPMTDRIAEAEAQQVNLEDQMYLAWCAQEGLDPNEERDDVAVGWWDEFWEALAEKNAGAPQIPPARPDARFLVTTRVDGELRDATRAADPFLTHVMDFTDDQTGHVTHVEIRVDGDQYLVYRVMQLVRELAEEPLEPTEPTQEHRYMADLFPGRAHEATNCWCFAEASDDDQATGLHTVSPETHPAKDVPAGGMESVTQPELNSLETGILNQIFHDADAQDILQRIHDAGFKVVRDYDR